MYEPGMFCRDCGARLNRRPTHEEASTCPMCNEVHVVEPQVRIVVIQPVRLSRGLDHGIIVMHEITSRENTDKNRLVLPEGRLTALGDWRRDAQRELREQTGIHQEVRVFTQLPFQSVPGDHLLLLFCQAPPKPEKDLPNWHTKTTPGGVVQVERVIETDPDKLSWSLQRKAVDDVMLSLRARQIPPPMPPTSSIASTVRLGPSHSLIPRTK